MTNRTKFLILLTIFAVLGGIYWGIGSIVMSMMMPKIYYVLCMVLSVFYILVAGGLRPIIDEDRRRVALYVVRIALAGRIKRYDFCHKFSLRLPLVKGAPSAGG